MHVLKRNPWLFGLGVLLAVLVVFGGHARADVTTDQPGSIVIFPKVVSDGTRDTVIELTNTSNMPALVDCFYVNAQAHCSFTGASCVLDSDCTTAGETCVSQCTEINFGPIFLTPQQPTAWPVSTGRNTVDSTGPEPRIPGLFSGNVPGRGTDFLGELKCIQVDTSEVPLGQNSLKGEASIVTLATGAISVYNGVTIQAPGNSPGVNNPGTGVFDLPLDNTVYNACPVDLVANIRSEGSTDSISGGTISNELTLVPCTELLEAQTPTHARALFSITDELENTQSAAITFDCMLNRRLAAIASTFGPATEFAKIRITPPTGNICYTGSNACTSANNTVPACNCTSDTDCGTGIILSADGTPLGCRPWSGLLGVLEEFDTTTVGTGHEAVNLHEEGSRQIDLIVAPIGAGSSNQVP